MSRESKPQESAKSKFDPLSLKDILNALAIVLLLPLLLFCIGNSPNENESNRFIKPIIFCGIPVWAAWAIMHFKQYREGGILISKLGYVLIITLLLIPLLSHIVKAL